MQRRLDDWLKTFMTYASFGEAPLKFYFWSGVSAIAGALRRRVWISQHNFQWTPNCYIILVAPPGVAAKSTTANVGMNLLREIPNINFGPNVVTWQKLVVDMAESKELVFWPEKEVYLPMSCITICSSELGTFLDPSNRDMVDVLVDLWDGQIGAFSKGTKGCGSDSIENPWINLIACVTPSWISTYMPESMIGGGFTSRCLFVYGSQKRQLIAYPAKHVPPDFHTTRDDLVHDLEMISTMIGEMTLSPEADAFGEQWYADHWSKKHPELPEEQFSGYLARKQTHIHKLAIILSASRSSELIVSLETLQTAISMIDALEQEMPRVFAKVGQSVVNQAMTDMLEIVAGARKIAKKELYRHLARRLTWFEFTNALQSAIEAGYVKQTVLNSEAFIVSLVE